MCVLPRITGRSVEVTQPCGGRQEVAPNYVSRFVPALTNSPAVVLTQAAQAHKTGLFTLIVDGVSSRVWLLGGRVAQVDGVPDLLRSVSPSGTLSGNLLQDVMVVCQAGVAFDDAYQAASIGLGRFIALNAESGATCGFEEGIQPPAGCIPMDRSVTRIVADGFRQNRSADDVAMELSNHLSRRLLPNGLDRKPVGLGPQNLRLLQSARGRTLVDVIDSAVREGPSALEAAWQGLDLLLHLGHLYIDGVGVQPEPEPKPAPEPVAEEPGDDLELQKEKAAELIELARTLEGQRPLDALGVAAERNLGRWLDVKKLDEIFRKLAASYHPDNHPKGPQRDAAGSVFSVLNQKRDLIQDAALLKEEIERLETIAEGRKWIPAGDRKQARVLFREVQRLEENKRWKAARKQLRKVMRLDNEASMYHIMRIWLDVILKDLTPEKAIAELDAVKLETVAHKVEANYRAGRIYRLANKTVKAYSRFQRVLELVPNHMGAAREARLIQRRAAAQKR